MESPSQFRQYLIAQDADGNNIEVTRSSRQVGVLAFDTERQVFVHCHVLLEALKNKRAFEERGQKFIENTHSSRARLFEFGEDEGNAFYITENVDGETLRSYLASQSTLPIWLAMRLTVQVLEGMHSLLDMGCPIPEQPLEAIRVWRSGAQSVMSQLADLPMTDEFSSGKIKVKQAKLDFLKQAQKLELFFSESMQRGELGGEALVEAEPFTELLSSLLSFFVTEAKAAFTEVIALFETRMPLPPAGELAVSLSPQPLVASFLECSQDLARSAMQSVRIQSQKVDLTNPYALSGTLMKSGQLVAIEQVPPERIAGKLPHESVSQMFNLSKAGKFPSLLPVVFLGTTSGIEYVTEPIVEGVALSELLEARPALDPFEIHLLLVRLDKALRSIENASTLTNRLRLEDIYLFTGRDLENTGATNLLKINLTEWPNFSIVLRAHLCMHAMTGRGRNPGIHLPLKLVAKKEREPLWHGGWVAALSCLLFGFSNGIPPRQRTGFAEVDGVLRLLDEEMKRSRKGNPSSRSVFLAHYAKEIESHSSPNAKSPESWMELSGGSVTKAIVEDTDKQSSIPVFLQENILIDVDRPIIGFAEALIQYPVVDEPEFLGGLRPMIAAPRTLSHDSLESSWMTIHEKKSFWWYFLWILFGSLVLGVCLAHVSGRAFWQKTIASRGFDIPSVEGTSATGVEIIDLPIARVPEGKVGATKLTPPAPLLPNLDPAGAIPISDLSKRTGSLPPIASVPKALPVVASPVMESPKASLPIETSLTAQLQMIRNNGKLLPSELRVETERAAQNGDKEAMLALGNLFLHGGAELRDEHSGFNWYDKASKAGEVAADFPLAECYLQGWGTAPDFARAVEYLSKASSKNDARAKDLLAVCYARGIGVAKDDAKAFALGTEAYLAGVPSACGNLGAMYLRGQGTAPDAERAVKLFEEGAKRNQADSMLLYAQSLEYGTGIAISVIEATNWYKKAAKSGSAEAANWCRTKGVTY